MRPSTAPSPVHTLACSGSRANAETIGWSTRSSLLRKANRFMWRADCATCGADAAEDTRILVDSWCDSSSRPDLLQGLAQRSKELVNHCGRERERWLQPQYVAVQTCHGDQHALRVKA